MFIYFPLHSLSINDVCNILYYLHDNGHQIITQYNEFLKSQNTRPLIYQTQINEQRQNIPIHINLAPPIIHGDPQDGQFSFLQEFIETQEQLIQVFYEYFSCNSQEKKEIQAFFSTLLAYYNRENQIYLSNSEIKLILLAFHFLHDLQKHHEIKIYLGNSYFPSFSSNILQYAVPAINILHSQLTKKKIPVSLKHTSTTLNSLQEFHKWFIVQLFFLSLINTVYTEPQNAFTTKVIYFPLQQSTFNTEHKETIYAPIYFGELTTESKTVLLETNLDDVTGEDLGVLYRQLLELGAKDVTIIPGFMKKNRPGWVIKIITPRDKEHEVLNALFRLTSTLGVRIFPLERHVSNRHITITEFEIMKKKYRVRIKHAGSHPLDYKPEHDDLLHIQQDTGLPLRVIRKLIDKEIMKKLDNE